MFTAFVIRDDTRIISKKKMESGGFYGTVQYVQTGKHKALQEEERFMSISCNDALQQFLKKNLISFGMQQDNTQIINKKKVKFYKNR